MLLIYTHYLFGVLVAALACYLAVCTIRLGRFGTLVLSVLVVAACSLPLLPAMWRIWEQRQFLNWTTHRSSLWELIGAVLPVDTDRLRELSSVNAALSAPATAARWWLFWLAMVGVAAVGVAAWPRSGTVLAWQQIEPGPKQSAGRPLPVLAMAIGAAVALWLLGRFWLTSLGAQRYLVTALPAGSWVVAALASVLLRSSKRHPVGLACVLVAATIATSLESRLALLWQLWNGKRVRTAVARRYSTDADWRNVAKVLSESPERPGLVLVGSGLAEMSLVPAYCHDGTFHDYVACRLGRMYLPGPTPRVGLPMFWDAETAAWYRAMLARSASSAGGGAAVWLVCATDTDLLRASLKHARAVLEDAGFKRRRSLKTQVLVYELWSTGLVPAGAAGQCRHPVLDAGRQLGGHQ